MSGGEVVPTRLAGVLPTLVPLTAPVEARDPARERLLAAADALREVDEAFREGLASSAGPSTVVDAVVVPPLSLLAHPDEPSDEVGLVSLRYEVLGPAGFRHTVRLTPIAGTPGRVRAVASSLLRGVGYPERPSALYLGRTVATREERYDGDTVAATNREYGEALAALSTLDLLEAYRDAVLRGTGFDEGVVAAGASEDELGVLPRAARSSAEHVVEWFSPLLVARGAGAPVEWARVRQSRVRSGGG